MDAVLLRDKVDLVHAPRKAWGNFASCDLPIRVRKRGQRYQSLDMITMVGRRRYINPKNDILCLEDFIQDCSEECAVSCRAWKLIGETCSTLNTTAMFELYIREYMQVLELFHTQFGSRHVFAAATERDIFQNVRERTKDPL